MLIMLWSNYSDADVGSTSTRPAAQHRLHDPFAEVLGEVLAPPAEPLRLGRFLCVPGAPREDRAGTALGGGPTGWRRAGAGAAGAGAPLGNGPGPQPGQDEVRTMERRSPKML